MIDFQVSTLSSALLTVWGSINQVYETETFKEASYFYIEVIWKFAA